MNKTLRATFINTSGKQNTEPFRIAPLGSLLLLTILEQEFGEVLDLDFIDLRTIEPHNHIYHIPERDVYFHFVTSPEFNEIKYIVTQIREVYPRALHLAGGPHCNIFPQESQAFFDSICIGEGEAIIKQMVHDIFTDSLKPAYTETRVIDINQNPYPLRKFLTRRAAVDYNLLSAKHAELLATTVLFSRGCPFNCHFCSNQYPGNVRYRAPELVYEEIEYLKSEYGIKALVIKDDNGIPYQKKQALEHIQAIAKADILWRAQTRANGIDPAAVKLAKEAGCVEITVAIESVWQQSLDIMNKKVNLKKAADYIQLIKSVGMDVKVLLIMGLPGEPKDIAKRTIEFIETIQPSNVSLSILCPIPGSELYKNPQRFGMKINPNVPFDKYLFAYGRFDEDEKAPQFFEYEKVTPFGPSLSMDEILQNHETIQEYLRDYNLNF